ncbi:hypothetical protein ACKWTF_000646 [Chironomus riparius]
MSMSQFMEIYLPMRKLFAFFFQLFSSSCQELFDNFIGAVNTILEKKIRLKTKWKVRKEFVKLHTFYGWIRVGNCWVGWSAFLWNDFVAYLRLRHCIRHN